MRPWNSINDLFDKPNQFGAITVDDLESFNYESPIKAIETKMQFEFEGELMRVVKSLGFDVSKDELLKALQFDREQYARGYRDGVANKATHAHWVDRYHNKYFNHLYECSACTNTALYKVECDVLGHDKIVQELSDYCPHCGARMDEECFNETD